MDAPWLPGSDTLRWLKYSRLRISIYSQLPVIRFEPRGRAQEKRWAESSHHFIISAKPRRAARSLPPQDLRRTGWLRSRWGAAPASTFATYLAIHPARHPWKLTQRSRGRGGGRVARGCSPAAVVARHNAPKRALSQQTHPGAWWAKEWHHGERHLPGFLITSELVSIFVVEDVIAIARVPSHLIRFLTRARRSWLRRLEQRPKN